MSITENVKEWTCYEHEIKVGDDNIFSSNKENNYNILEVKE